MYTYNGSCIFVDGSVSYLTQLGMYVYMEVQDCIV